MVKLHYELLIRFEGASCLGSQLAAILKTILEFSGNGTWYASDVDTTCDNLKISHLRGPRPKKIGSIDDMIDLVKTVQQFLYGVFILLSVDAGKELKVECYTEDDPFRTCDNIIFEIRTFDTSYFLIYSNNLQILNTLKAVFGGEINT